MSIRILVVEKSGSEGDPLGPALQELGYIVSRVTSRKAALAEAEGTLPDLVILDGSSPRLNGPKTCRMLREIVGELPIILIWSQKDTVDESVEADVHLVHPVALATVVQHIQRLIPSPDGPYLRVGDLTLNLETHEVARQGDEARRMTPKQCKLLETFMRHPGRVLTRKFLMKRVWNTDYLGDTRTLDVHVRWVREHIEPDPSRPIHLHTVRRVGYRFTAVETGEHSQLPSPSADSPT